MEQHRTSKNPFTFIELKGGNGYMGNISALFLAAFLLVGTLGGVFAQEANIDTTAEANTEENVNANADVSIEARNIGFFENALDRIRYLLTFNDERKQELALQNAEERLSQLDRFNDEDEIRRAERQYEYWMDEHKKSIIKLTVRLENAGYTDEEIVRILDAQTRLDLHNERFVARLEQLLERLEAEGADEEEIERLEALYAEAVEKSEESQATIDTKLGLVKNSARVQLGENEEAFNERIAELRRTYDLEEKDLSQLRERLAAVKDKRIRLASIGANANVQANAEVIADGIQLSAKTLGIANREA